jgi:hypothetical protein
VVAGLHARVGGDRRGEVPVDEEVLPEGLRRLDAVGLEQLARRGVRT